MISSVSNISNSSASTKASTTVQKIANNNKTTDFVSTNAKKPIV